jgi:hypothetical protein
MLAASMIWGCRSLGDWLQAADLRGASGSLGGEVVGRGGSCPTAAPNQATNADDQTPDDGARTTHKAMVV